MIFTLRELIKKNKSAKGATSNGSKNLVTTLFLSVVFSCKALAANDSKMYFDFAFNTFQDGQNALILDYKLQANEEILIEENKKISQAVGGLRSQNINKFGHLPTNLYVRWKNPSTGKIYERSADLHGKLPDDIEGYTIYFMIINDQLQIYLASTKRRKDDQAAVGPLFLHSLETQLIYSSEDIK